MQAFIAASASAEGAARARRPAPLSGLPATDGAVEGERPVEGDPASLTPIQFCPFALARIACLSFVSMSPCPSACSSMTLELLELGSIVSECDLSIVPSGFKSGERMTTCVPFFGPSSESRSERNPPS
jgi:hypothetical protein